MEKKGKRRVHLPEMQASANRRNEAEETHIFEISEKETLIVTNNILELKRRGSPNKNWKIVFDGFIYIQFVRCLHDICLFMSMPNSLQYRALLRFQTCAKKAKLSKDDFANQSSNFDFVLGSATSMPDVGEDQKFLLKNFLKLNLPVLYAHSQLQYLLGE